MEAGWLLLLVLPCCCCGVCGLSLWLRIGEVLETTLGLWLWEKVAGGRLPFSEIVERWREWWCGVVWCGVVVVVVIWLSGEGEEEEGCVGVCVCSVCVGRREGVREGGGGREGACGGVGVLVCVCEEEGVGGGGGEGGGVARVEVVVCGSDGVY